MREDRVNNFLSTIDKGGRLYLLVAMDHLKGEFEIGITRLISHAPRTMGEIYFLVLFARLFRFDCYRLSQMQIPIAPLNFSN